MNKEKRIWIALFLALTLMVILSGCSGLPNTAKLNISFDPDPSPYSSGDGYWPFTITISESNGIGVTLTSLRFDAYNQAGQFIDTQWVYEDEIIEWFGSNYIAAFSSIQTQDDFGFSAPPGEEFTKYEILTIEGVDDNNNPIEATGSHDFLPQ
jgi:hypothetical protein